jgi:hypothetical protein
MVPEPKNGSAHLERLEALEPLELKHADRQLRYLLAAWIFKTRSLYRSVSRCQSPGLRRVDGTFAS